MPLKRKSFLILQFACFSIFIGRFWQFCFWDAPYRTLIWDQTLMEFPVSLIGYTWKEWVSSAHVDLAIQYFIFSSGLVYLLAAFSVYFFTHFQKVSFGVIKLAIALLCFLFLLKTKENYFQLGQFLEHSSQLGAPVLLLLVLDKGLSTAKFIYYAKALISVTFIGHGLFALGVYPRPGVFVDLVMNIFPFSESLTHQLIYVIGLVDFVFAILVFFPKTVKIALWYMFVWGMLTAFSRVVSEFQLDFWAQSLHQSLHTTIYRLVHGLLPLSVLIAITSKKES